MSWKTEVEEIEERRELARKMGGDEAVEKQHQRGRLSVRERIDHMADPGSFHEHGPMAGHPERDDAGKLVDFSPANYVVGFARVGGRPVATDRGAGRSRSTH